MDNGMATNGLLRMVGVMAICVGIAWLVQIFGFSHGPDAVSRLIWFLAAASVSGAGVGLVVAAGTMPAPEEVQA